MVNTIESRSSYRHGKTAPCTHRYLRPVILDVCRRYGLQRVLDVGCGNGALCRDLVDAGLSVVGTEPSASGVAAARELVPEAVFYELGVYDAPSGVLEGLFDVVVSTEVIEHLFKPSALPEFAAAKLKPDGYLVLSTPYHGYLKNVAIAVSGRWDSHHSPAWEGGHCKFWSRRSLTRFLAWHGFHVLEFHGVGRVPWLWTSMVLVARWKGLQDVPVATGTPRC